MLVDSIGVTYEFEITIYVPILPKCGDDLTTPEEKKFSELLSHHYRTGNTNWAQDFYAQILPHCNIGYWRASAYFSSSLYGMPAMKKAISTMIENGGTIRLLTSNKELYKHDVDAAKQGYRDRVEKNDVTNRSEFLKYASSKQTMKGYELIYNLIKFNLMDWKVVTRVKSKKALYHEKIGFFLQSPDEYYYFNGSLNESMNAATFSHESVEVFHSKKNPIVCDSIKRIFTNMWLNLDDNLEVCIVHAAEIEFKIKKQFINTNPEDANEPIEEGVEEMEYESLTLRHYQEDAVNAFLKDGAGNGVFSMATGTGKTRTANYILKYLFEAGEINSAIVCVGNAPVLEQWTNSWHELKNRYGLVQIENIYTHYGGKKDLRTYGMNPVNKLLVIGRSSPSRLSRVVKMLTPEQKQKLLLIHDEVHGLGAPVCREKLLGHTEHIRYTLGLSATWERYDDEETEFISSEIGGGSEALFSYSLEQAIRDGWLIEFDYLPLEYSRSVEDAERFEEKSRGNSMPWEHEDVYKQSLEKTKAFEKWVNENKTEATKMLESCVFFCKTKAQGESIADVLIRVLHFSKHHQYYSSEITGQASDPKNVLEKFKSGELTTLITAGKLDQGFDMPELKNVVLMESDASDFSEKRRKLVQRIGRMLRIDPKNEAKRGFVLDFVRLIKDDDYLESTKNHEEEDRNKPLLGGISTFDLDRSTWLQEVSMVKKVKKND